MQPSPFHCHVIHLISHLAETLAPRPGLFPLPPKEGGLVVGLDGRVLLLFGRVELLRGDLLGARLVRHDALLHVVSGGGAGEV